MFYFPLPALFLTTTVLAASLRPRDFNCRQTSIDYKGLVHYSPSFPTCANDGHLIDTFGTPANVKVQPDCDPAIATACAAVNLMFDINRNLYPIKSVSDSCEVNILFSQQHVSQIKDYDRSSCTTKLQSITETCMLIGTGKFAAPGQQAGIINLLYDTIALDRNDGHRFAANVECNDQPAYLVGSPGYFKDPNPYSGGITQVGKDIGGVPAGSISRDCLLSDNCA
jgi:hypothetical protein